MGKKKQKYGKKPGFIARALTVADSAASPLERNNVQQTRSTYYCITACSTDR
jgi:hypothetical protein